MDLLTEWRDKGLLTAEQARLLSDIESGRLFSVSNELQALLYFGALLIVAGVGATVKTYVLELGPLAITAGLGAAAAACLGYCFKNALPYSRDKTEPPTHAFDYVLYLGCAFVGILFGYLETRYHWLGPLWDFYLLASAALFFGLAYRFDNRFVLSMALINLAGWFGLRFSKLDVPLFDLRAQALVFGSAAAGAGWLLENRARVKVHFRDVYDTIGLNVLFAALLGGLFENGLLSLDAAALAGLAALTIRRALRRRRFQYFFYGTVYGYIECSYAASKMLPLEYAWVLFWFVQLAGSIALIALLFSFRRRLEQGA